MTTREIQAYIREHAPEQARIRRLQDYYRGKHDIAKKLQKDPSKPNNRLCCGFPAMIANAFSGYLFGKPVTYACENAALLESIQDALRYNDEQAHNAALGLDLAICGAAVEILYLDRGANVRFARVDPASCVAVREESIEANLAALIRYYDVRDIVEGTARKYIEVYDEREKTVYTSMMAGDALQEIERSPHGFGDVPAVIYKNNAEGMGDFEGVMTLIDAYDLMQSDSINEQEYFSDAYLVMRGMEGTESGDVARMKEDRLLLVPQDADVTWLLKQQSDGPVENVKNRLNNDIHRFSGCPDMTDENFAGNSSGVAIEYKLLQFENIAGSKEREFKRGLQRRLELLCNIWHTLGRGSFDWRDATITFKRALPKNLLELAQTASNLGSIVSNETKRAMLPLEIDEKTEKARLESERRDGLSLYESAFQGNFDPEDGEDA